MPKTVYMRADQIQPFRELSKNDKAVFIYKDCWRFTDNYNPGGHNFQFSLADAHRAAASYEAADGEWKFIVG